MAPKFPVIALCLLPATLLFSCKDAAETSRPSSAKPAPSSTAAGGGESPQQTTGLQSEAASPAGSESDDAPDTSPAAVSPRTADAARLMDSGKWPDVRLDFYREWAAESPLEAIQHALGNNPGASTVCVSAILAGWREKDPAAALTWVNGNPPYAERSFWTEELARHWPENRLDELDASVAALAGAPAGTRATGAYAARLIDQAPGLAFDWMNRSITDPAARAETVSHVMANWATTDTERASGWLAAIPTDEPWRDDAISGLVKGTAFLDLDTARQWVAAMADETRRAALLAWLDQEFPDPSSPPAPSGKP